MSATSITLAANNGEIGGGEVMLLHLAKALDELGTPVDVVGPDADGGVLDAAEEAGYAVTRLASSRRRFLRELREWDSASRRGVLWCNGLVPAVATAGRRGRIVHLHQVPAGAHRPLARGAAVRSVATLVPSRMMQREVPRSTVLWNWTGDLPSRPDGARQRLDDDVLTIGFLGRPGPAKGVDVLGEALALLDASAPGRFRLLLAGEARFVGASERAKVERALAPLGHLIDRVGWIERSTFFQSVDIAAFPSVWSEPFGLVTAEAMASRTPFVISDAGALPEVAGPEHPWVARAGDAADLARVLAQASVTPPGELAAYLDRGRARWEQHFSPDAGRDRLARLLSQHRLV